MKRFVASSVHTNLIAIKDKMQQKTNWKRNNNQNEKKNQTKHTVHCWLWFLNYSIENWKKKFGCPLTFFNESSRIWRNFTLQKPPRLCIECALKKRSTEKLAECRHWLYRVFKWTERECVIKRHRALYPILDAVWMESVLFCCARCFFSSLTRWQFESDELIKRWCSVKPQYIWAFIDFRLLMAHTFVSIVCIFFHINFAQSRQKITAFFMSILLSILFAVGSFVAIVVVVAFIHLSPHTCIDFPIGFICYHKSAMKRFQPK